MDHDDATAGSVAVWPRDVGLDLVSVVTSDPDGF
jgi:hypothetical protein